jgi:hypothetical protein
MEVFGSYSVDVDGFSVDRVERGHRVGSVESWVELRCHGDKVSTRAARQGLGPKRSSKQK